IADALVAPSNGAEVGSRNVTTGSRRALSSASRPRTRSRIRADDSRWSHTQVAGPRKMEGPDMAGVIALLVFTITTIVLIRSAGLLDSWRPRGVSVLPIAFA